MRLKYFSFPKSYLHLIQFSFHEKTQVLFLPKDLLKIEKIMLKLENLKREYFVGEDRACKLKSLSAVKFAISLNVQFGFDILPVWQSQRIYEEYAQKKLYLKR